MKPLTDEEIRANLARFAFAISEETLAMRRTFRIAQLGYDPNQPRDERGRWTDTGAGPDYGNLKPLAEPDGGFTLDAAQLKPMTTGWAVAVKGSDRLMLAADSFDADGEPTAELIDLTMERIEAAKAAAPVDGTELALGGWHNPADGKVEVNVTFVFPADAEARARQFAVDNDQIAMANLDAIAAGDWANAIVNTGGTGGDRDTDKDRKLAVRRRFQFGGFDPNQPRVPAGSSTGGQWTDGNGSAPATEIKATKATKASKPVKVTRDNIESIVDNSIQRDFDKANGVTGKLENRDFTEVDGDYWSVFRAERMAQSDDPATRVVGRYAQDSKIYEAMNKALRGTRKPTKQTEADIADLQATIDAATPTKKTFVAYRGIGKGVLPADLAVGTEITEPGFLSTSISEGVVSSNFDTPDGDILHITVPAGTKAIIGDSFEHEVLIQSGATMRVVEVRDKPSRFSSGREIVVELVPRGG
jgi:hypothetical protein